MASSNGFFLTRIGGKGRQRTFRYIFYTINLACLATKKAGVNFSRRDKVSFCLEYAMHKKEMELLIATSNHGKVREIEELFLGTAVRFRSLLDFSPITEVPETGSTFEENAILKARGYALQTGIWALADDSGLEIAALDNAPGVLSARYGGNETSFDQKTSMLLGEMDLAENKRRDARFVCSMALANGKGDILATAEGICEGKIADAPRGNRGFGYDPMFIPAGFDETFGELADNIKSEISHRARASAKIMRYLLGFIAV